MPFARSDVRPRRSAPAPVGQGHVRRPPIFVALLLLAAPTAGAAQRPDSTAVPRITLQGFADTYYAWDTGRPPQRDRALTTQAVRHSEFNVNLAHVGVTLEGARVRGRVALQAGTSVQANYAGEPAVGATSGSEVSRHIQEAVAGVRLARGLWADAGIYLSPIGHESWISAENPTYTRSLTADYTPYYLAGARASWQATSSLAVQAHVVNGWQKISDDDEGKALVVRVDWTAGRTTVSFAGFAGAERAATADTADDPRARRFGQLLLRTALDGRTTLWLSADAGHQTRASGDAATWGSLTGVVRRTLSPTVSIAARGERYIDRAGAVLAADGAGAAVSGLSANADVRLPGGALWRTETRWLRADRAVFPDRRGTRRTDVLLVTSLALTFDRVLGAPSAP